MFHTQYEFERRPCFTATDEFLGLIVVQENAYTCVACSQQEVTVSNVRQTSGCSVVNSL